MEIISGPRQSGKTTALLNRLHKDPVLYLVVLDKQEQSDIHRNPMCVGVSDRIITWRDIDSLRSSTKNYKLMFDGLDRLLGRMFGADIDVASFDFPVKVSHLSMGDVAEGWHVEEPAEPTEPEEPVETVLNTYVKCETCRRQYKTDGTAKDVLERSREHAGHKVKVTKIEEVVGQESADLPDGYTAGDTYSTIKTMGDWKFVQDFYSRSAAKQQKMYEMYGGVPRHSYGYATDTQRVKWVFYQPIKVEKELTPVERAQQAKTKNRYKYNTPIQRMSKKSIKKG